MKKYDLMDKYMNAPKDYICPICLGVQGVENDHTLIHPSDFVYKDDQVSALINSFWIGENKGHVIIVPNEHYENIYEIPEEVGHRIFDVSKILTIAIREVYKAEGITLRQNNEPAGDQHAFHYHLHIFPRYAGDEFNLNASKKSKLHPPEERAIYAEKLKKYLKSK